MRAAYIPVGAPSHILASLPMVDELVRRGVEVDYFGLERVREHIEATGAVFHAMPAVAARGNSVDAGNDFIAGIPLVFLGEAEGVIDTVLSELEKKRPDVIIADELALAGRIAAKVLNVPMIMSFTSYAPCSAFSICRTWPQYPDTNPARAAAKEVAERLHEKYGVPVYGVNEIFEGVGELNISALSKELQPASNQFDPSFIFTGPQIGYRWPESSWTPPADGKPLLYTSLGSLFNNWKGFYDMLFPIVREMDIHVLCSIGKQLRPEDLGEIPENVELMPFVPQLDVLKNASWFITHAGTGSAMETLHYGVPCICIPQMDEQRFTASRLELLGISAGTMDKRTMTREILSAALHNLMEDPSYAERAKVLSETTQKSGGCVRAADEIVAFIRKKNAEGNQAG